MVRELQDARSLPFVRWHQLRLHLVLDDLTGIEVRRLGKQQVIAFTESLVLKLYRRNASRANTRPSLAAVAVRAAETPRRDDTCIRLSSRISDCIASSRALRRRRNRAIAPVMSGSFRAAASSGKQQPSAVGVQPWGAPCAVP